MFDRLRAAIDIHPAEGSSNEDVRQTLGKVAPSLKTAADGWPEADRDVIAMFADMDEELTKLLSRVDLARNETRRAEYQQSFSRKSASKAVTAVRYAVRIGEIAAVTKTLWPETFQAAIDGIRALYTTIPWPWD